MNDARARLLAGLPVEERRLEPAGLPTTVLEGGDGPPVVLLVAPGSAAHWLHVLPALAASRRVIAPDLPGQGGSPPPAEPLGPDRVLAWLGELIDATCPAPPLVVGAAIGGGVAARLAAAHGPVGRLVLVGALGLADFAPAPAFGQALHAFLGAPAEETHDALWGYCAHDLGGLRDRMGPRWQPFRAYNVQRAQAPGVLEALGALMDAFGMRAIPDRDLAAIEVPTALVWGRHDPATPVAVAQAVAERHGWPLEIVEDAAADPHVEQPQAFLAALERVAPVATAHATGTAGR